MGYTNILCQAGKGPRIPGASPKAFWKGHEEINWGKKQTKKKVAAQSKSVVK
jgi:hypothetical protein